MNVNPIINNRRSVHVFFHALFNLSFTFSLQRRVSYIYIFFIFFTDRMTPPAKRNQTLLKSKLVWTSLLAIIIFQLFLHRHGLATRDNNQMPSIQTMPLTFLDKSEASSNSMISGFCVLPIDGSARTCPSPYLLFATCGRSYDKGHNEDEHPKINQREFSIIGYIEAIEKYRKKKYSHR